MLRLENPGNYPTPIAAADRIDIVRGPASPIYGPSKTGGYMNFVPKTARAANGTYAPDPTGFVSYETGSWGATCSRAISPARARSATTSSATASMARSRIRQLLPQHPPAQPGSVGRVRHRHHQQPARRIRRHVPEVPWPAERRLEPPDPGSGRQRHLYHRQCQQRLDINHDGQISRAEARAANGGKGLSIFGSFACPGGGIGASGWTDACLKANYPDLALVNPGTTTLSKRDTLTGPNDKLNNDQKTFYFDLIWTGPGKLEIKNQLFYDGTKNLNENYYGFSQKIDSYVLEDKVVISDSFTTSAGKFSIQAAPSCATPSSTLPTTSAWNCGTGLTSPPAIPLLRPASFRPIAIAIIPTISWVTISMSGWPAWSMPISISAST
jgi:iron complex outermembrane receptor protein